MSYYFINDKGQQQGPVSIQNLVSHGITLDTLVWKAGMTQWTKAKEISELKEILMMPPFPPPLVEYHKYSQDLQNNSRSKSMSSDMKPHKPDNYMVWAVLCTLFCCIPIGIYSIYCAAQVDSCYKRGEYADAQKYANKAKQWAIVSAIIGAVCGFIYAILMIVVEMQ